MTSENGDSLEVGVECGQCAGSIYFETDCCDEWVTASECHNCGARHEIECAGCSE